MTRDIASLVAAAGRHDADAFVAHLTPDVRSVFANTEPTIGRENVKKATTAFWDTIDGVTFEGDLVSVSQVYADLAPLHA